jgi:hypothetical protein
MIMTDEEVKECAAKLKAWLATDEGKARMAQAAVEADKIQKKIEDICRVSPEIMRMKVNI